MRCHHASRISHYEFRCGDYLSARISLLTAAWLLKLTIHRFLRFLTNIEVASNPLAAACLEAATSYDPQLLFVIPSTHAALVCRGLFDFARAAC
jgi:hypothetical protein